MSKQTRRENVVDLTRWSPSEKLDCSKDVSLAGADAEMTRLVGERGLREKFAISSPAMARRRSILHTADGDGGSVARLNTRRSYRPILYLRGRQAKRQARRSPPAWSKRSPTSRPRGRPREAWQATGSLYNAAIVSGTPLEAPPDDSAVPETVGASERARERTPRRERDAAI